VPVFPKPRTRYQYDPAAELAHLRSHKEARAVPHKKSDRLLLVSWNIANFGAQLRRECDLRLIAEVLSWFDLAAIQECRENFADLYDVLGYLGPTHRVVMSDAGGITSGWSSCSTPANWCGWTRSARSTCRRTGRGRFICRG
jgi:hypothetical protein